MVDMFYRATLTLDVGHAERISELYIKNKMYRRYSTTRMSACARREANTPALRVSYSPNASNA